jgi:predicted PurR-regulated permease PerM
VQYLEANLIFPYVVGRFVHLNTLVTIIAMMVGGLIWGVAGMILFVPLLAILRVIATHYPELKTWEDFLGN